MATQQGRPSSNRLALAISIAALAVAATSLVLALRAAPRAEREELDDSVAAVERRLATLEQRSREQPLFARPSALPSDARTAAPSQLPTNPEVVARMEQLHQRLGALEARAEKERQALDERELRRKEEIRQAHTAILDRRADPGERLRALKKLRSANERTHEESLAALELIENPAIDPDIRSDLISELKGLTFPELKTPLLTMLAKTTHEDTRKEAVQVLFRYLDDPTVAQALAHARDQDPSDTVRREARKRIEQWQSGRPGD
jgi:hypothetical protein